MLVLYIYTVYKLALSILYNFSEYKFCYLSNYIQYNFLLST